MLTTAQHSAWALCATMEQRGGGREQGLERVLTLSHVHAHVHVRVEGQRGVRWTPAFVYLGNRLGTPNRAELAQSQGATLTMA